MRWLAAVARARGFSSEGMAAPKRSRIDVAAGVLCKDDRFLVTLRPAGKHLAGLWEFPGGKREPGETWEACLTREMKEELDLEVSVGGLLYETSHDYPERTVSLRFYRCRLVTGTPRAIGVQEFQWVARERLADLPFPPADAELLRLLRDGVCAS